MAFSPHRPDAENRGTTDEPFVPLGHPQPFYRSPVDTFTQSVMYILSTAKRFLAHQRRLSYHGYALGNQYHSRQRSCRSNTSFSFDPPDTICNTSATRRRDTTANMQAGQNMKQYCCSSARHTRSAAAGEINTS